MAPKRHPITGKSLAAGGAVGSRAGDKALKKLGVEGGGEDIAAFTLKVLSYIGLCALGFVLGATAGFFMGQGLMTILGAFVGVVIGLVLAIFCTGDFGAAMDAGEDRVRNVTEPLIPAFAREVAFGHDYFSILVTVHHVRTTPDDLLTLKATQFDAFVTVACGDNPMKSTCISQDCDFEETFKFRVRPRDARIDFALKDQELLSDDVVGICSVPISDILNRGFPVQKTYHLLGLRHQQKVGNIMVSFDWTDDFPKDRLAEMQKKNPSEFSRRLQMREQVLSSQDALKGKAYAYGTFVQQSSIFQQPGKGP
jgi:hypothetical protein